MMEIMEMLVVGVVMMMTAMMMRLDMMAEVVVVVMMMMMGGFDDEAADGGDRDGERLAAPSWEGSLKAVALHKLARELLSRTTRCLPRRCVLALAPTPPGDIQQG